MYYASPHTYIYTYIIWAEESSLISSLLHVSSGYYCFLFYMCTCISHIQQVIGSYKELSTFLEALKKVDLLKTIESGKNLTVSSMIRLIVYICFDILILILLEVFQYVMYYINIPTCVYLSTELYETHVMMFVNYE